MRSGNGFTLLTNSLYCKTKSTLQYGASVFSFTRSHGMAEKCTANGLDTNALELINCPLKDMMVDAIGSSSILTVLLGFRLKLTDTGSVFKTFSKFVKGINLVTFPLSSSPRTLVSMRNLGIIISAAYWPAIILLLIKLEYFCTLTFRLWKACTDSSADTPVKNVELLMVEEFVVRFCDKCL